MIRIALVDKHRLFRKSIGTLLNSFERAKVLFDTDNVLNLIEYLKHNDVDVVLIDIQNEEFLLCQNLKHKKPELRIINLTEDTEYDQVLKTIETGLDGFFSKNSEPFQLEQAICGTNNKGFSLDSELRTVMETAKPTSRKLNQPKLSGYRERFREEALVSITHREMDIIQLVCKEYNSTEIADILNINVRTVETHRKRLIDKVKTKNFIGVIMYAIKNKLLQVE